MCQVLAFIFIFIFDKTEIYNVIVKAELSL